MTSFLYLFQIQLTRAELVKLSKKVKNNTDLDESEDDGGENAANVEDEFDMEHYNDEGE